MVRLNLLSHLFDRITYLNYFGVMQIVQIYFYEIKKWLNSQDRAVIPVAPWFVHD